MGERLIFHVDVNSAFLSWESARRVGLGESDLRDIPAAIGGDREKRTGIILAKSIPAKRMGVQTGEAVGMALRKCPNLVLVKPDFSLYRECSQRFMDICRAYAPVVEQFSIDECFLDLTGTGRIYPDPVALAHTIKDRIHLELGFTVNVGIGSNKLLAKTASDFEKPNRVHTLFAQEIPGKFWPLPVGELLFVGKATAQRLNRAGIATVGDLAHADRFRLEALFGANQARQLIARANGIDNSPVRTEPEEAKGYSISTTLEEDVVTVEQARQILLTLADRVSARMRREGAKAYCVGVTIRDLSFRNRSHQKKLPEPTDITGEIFRLSMELFAQLWDGKTPLRLLGISLTEVTREEFSQVSLFRDEQREKSRKVDQAVDTIRSRFGRELIGRAAVQPIPIGKKDLPEKS